MTLEELELIWKALHSQHPIEDWSHSVQVIEREIYFKTHNMVTGLPNEPNRPKLTTELHNNDIQHGRTIGPFRDNGSNDQGKDKTNKK